MTTNLKTNYLIVGAGAVGMSFADTLLDDSDANIIIVDRNAKPGGHWNQAYPFVTLHQPSSFYGVASTELSTGRRDLTGLNKGLGHLATGAEINAYFDGIMTHRFLPSGRVQYFPMCEYTGDGNFHRKMTGDAFHVSFDKIVDCTFLHPTLPSTHTPNFTIEDGVQFMPLNDLPNLKEPAEGFVVIGGGKTGIDAVLWLLENSIHPDKITWIKSRDAWLFDRENTQTADDFFHSAIEAQAAQFEAIAASTSIEDMFDRLEACGYFLRLDPDVRPSMFHAATISKAELAELRKLRNIIRLGRVQTVKPNEIVLDNGSIPTSPKVVHVDCSATAIPPRDPRPIFDGNLIVPQTVRAFQPALSASLIAHVDVTYDDVEYKKQICGFVPVPNHDTDFIKMTVATMLNQYMWGQDKELRQWISENRLDGVGRMIQNVAKDDTVKRAVVQRLRDNVMPAVGKLQGYMAELEATNS